MILLLYVTLVVIWLTIVVGNEPPLDAAFVSVPIGMCPEGLQQVDDFCYGSQYANKIYTCPEGTIHTSNNNCISYESQPAYLTCPKDYTLKGNHCTYHREETPTYLCPTNYSLTQDSAFCERDYLIPAEEYCPKNTETKIDKLNQLSCVERITVPPIQTCPKDYHLHITEKNKNICIREIFYEPRLLCDKGFQLIDNICQNMNCKKNDCDMIEPLLICNNNDQVINNSCMNIDFKEPILICENTNELYSEKNPCIENSYHSIQYQCTQKNFFLQGQYCVKKIKVPSAYGCSSEGFNLIVKGENEHIIDIVDTKKRNNNKNEYEVCLKEEIIDAFANCIIDRENQNIIEVEVMRNEICYIKKSISPKIECPKGYDLTNNKNINNKNENKLLNEKHDNTVCTMNVTYPLLYICLFDGYVYDYNSRECIKDDYLFKSHNRETIEIKKEEQVKGIQEDDKSFLKRLKKRIKALFNRNKEEIDKEVSEVVIMQNIIEHPKNININPNELLVPSVTNINPPDKVTPIITNNPIRKNISPVARPKRIVPSYSSEENNLINHEDDTMKLHPTIQGAIRNENTMTNDININQNYNANSNEHHIVNPNQNSYDSFDDFDDDDFSFEDLQYDQNWMDYDDEFAYEYIIEN